MNVEDMKKNAAQAAGLLKQLANENRLWILCQLLEGELSVGELNERVDLSQSALSQHLAKLRQEGLVSTRKQGLNVYYSLGNPAVAKVLETLHSIYCSTQPITDLQV